MIKNLLRSTGIDWSDNSEFLALFDLYQMKQMVYLNYLLSLAAIQKKL